jgi:hypothetical protein
VIADPAILKIWQGEGVSAFPPDQLSSEAGRKVLKSEISRWGDVIRANNIHIEQ